MGSNMELAKAGIIVVAILLIYPYDECSGAFYSSYPIERILRSIQDNYHHHHHHQRSQSDDRHQNDYHQNDRHQNQYNQNDRYENDHYHNQQDRHENEYHQNEQHQSLRHRSQHQQNDRSQNHHHHNDRHDDLRWSRPQEFEIIHAGNDPVPFLGKQAREQDREINDPVLLDMEVKPIDTQYEIISGKDTDTEQKPQKVFISAADKKPGQGRKHQRQHRPKASVHENIAVNSLKYSKVSKLNK